MSTDSFQSSPQTPNHSRDACDSGTRTPAFPTVFHRTVTVPSTDKVSEHRLERSLRLAVLACEPNPPYGPNEHTSQLLMDLLELCLQRRTESALTNPTNDFSSWSLTLEIFDVQKYQYPRDFNQYDGFIIPGSFAAAYDSQEWIQHLKSVICKELYGNSRRTLGICFGHQVISHALSQSGGRAVPTPTGVRVGPQTMILTTAGQVLLGTGTDPTSNAIDLFVTHGDMVESLPSCAVNLGGCEKVPIQAAAYFVDNKAAENDKEEHPSRPFAVTFQAHPEYATSMDLGVERTLFTCMDAMVARGALNEAECEAYKHQAKQSFETIQRQSIATMTRAFQLLGWFDGSELECTPQSMR